LRGGVRCESITYIYMCFCIYTYTHFYTHGVPRHTPFILISILLWICLRNSLHLTCQESSKVVHHPANIAMAATMIGRLNMVIYSPSLWSFEVLFVLRRWSQLSLLPPTRFTHPRYPLDLEGTIYIVLPVHA